MWFWTQTFSCEYWLWSGLSRKTRNTWHLYIRFLCALSIIEIFRWQVPSIAELDLNQLIVGVHLFLMWTISSWLNCALRDDEVVYWVSIGHYEALADGNWWCWVSRGHLCLYILNKVDIWTGVTDALLTDWLTDRLSLNVKKLFDLVPHFNCWWWLTGITC